MQQDIYKEGVSRKFYMNKVSSKTSKIARKTLVMESLFYKATGFYQKETLVQVFLWEFFKIYKSTYFPRTVCNFQSMKSPVELNSLFSKFFRWTPGLLYHLIRRDSGRFANKVFQLNGLKITNWEHLRLTACGLSKL